MNRTLHTTILSGFSAILLSACTQAGVDVVMKGNQYFGKGSQYANARPASQPEEVFEPTFEEPTYETSANVDVISSSPIAAPETVAVAELAAPEPQSLSANELAPLEVAPVEAPSMEPVIAQSIEEKPVLAPLSSASSSGFIWPVQGKVVSHFGPKKNGLVNDGINIAASEGEPIWAASTGEVVYSGNELKGYGNMVIIRHAKGYMTAYAHASDVLVTKGDRIAQGDLIGYVGSTGSVNKPQLHFGIREGKSPVNPEELLPRRLASAN